MHIDHASTVQCIIRKIKMEIKNGVDIRCLVAYSGYSAGHLQRIFKLSTGTSLGTFIRERRIILAEKDLRRSNKSIMEIAIEYGFNNQQGFSRTFKQVTGVQPSKIRRQGNDSASCYGHYLIIGKC